MLCRPHRPAKKGNPKQFSFRYPAKLKSREALNQYGDVDVALMINHKNILLFRIELAQAIDLHSHAANLNNQPGPESGDSMHMLAVGIKDSNQDYQESRWHGDHRDHKQL